MNKFKLGLPMRLFFLFTGAVMSLGVWLTGIELVHWLLFVPPAFFLLAAVTGICPGIIFWNRVVGKSN